MLGMKGVLCHPRLNSSKEAKDWDSFTIGERRGMASLTARSISGETGSTPRVIFGQFVNISLSYKQRLLVLVEWS